MEIILLGTGGPDGLPVPGCPCAACCTAVGDAVRSPTSVLVDGVLLIDPRPGSVSAAARAGRPAGGVRQALVSAAGPQPELPGLPAPRRPPPGEESSLPGGYRVRAVPLDGPGTGYAVRGPAGERLLYLPAGRGPAEPAKTARAVPSGAGPSGAEPFGTVLLDAVARPDVLARLRAAGAVGPGTDVVAVHLSHQAPGGAELHRLLAAHGARAAADGGTAGGTQPPRPAPVPRRTLVLGGARSGKSAEAERRLAAFPEVVYVATGGGRPGDAEWEQRVRLHRERRPAAWSTAETCDLVPLLRSAGPPLLIDCLSLWLTDAMDAVGAWDEDRWADGGQRELAARTAELAAAWRRTGRTVVAVSNEVGSGVVPATAAGRRFRDELGRLNAAIAARSEHVLLVVAGTALALRG